MPNMHNCEKVHCMGPLHASGKISIAYKRFLPPHFLSCHIICAISVFTLRLIYFLYGVILLSVNICDQLEHCIFMQFMPLNKHHCNCLLLQVHLMFKYLRERTSVLEYVTVPEDWYFDLLIESGYQVSRYEGLVHGSLRKSCLFF